jgi:hypothetical protein
MAAKKVTPLPAKDKPKGKPQGVVTAGIPQDPIDVLDTALGNIDALLESIFELEGSDHRHDDQPYVDYVQSLVELAHKQVKIAYAAGEKLLDAAKPQQPRNAKEG